MILNINHDLLYNVLHVHPYKWGVSILLNKWSMWSNHLCDQGYVVATWWALPIFDSISRKISPIKGDNSCYFARLWIPSWLCMWYQHRPWCCHHHTYDTVMQEHDNIVLLHDGYRLVPLSPPSPNMSRYAPTKCCGHYLVSYGAHVSFSNVDPAGN